MTDQNTFMEVLSEVSEIIRTAEVPLSEDEIMAYFGDMELSAGQKRLILDYLENRDNTMEAENGQTGIDEASENSKVLQAYMEDLSLLETYDDKEMMELYRRLFSGEEEVVELISTAWLTKVLNIARKYMDLHSRLEDLIQEGNMALLLRLTELTGTPDCSDTEKSFEEIEKELSEIIERGIIDYISEWNREVQKENTLVGKLSLLHEADRFLKEEYGEEPTIEELAGYTNMSVDEIRILKDFTTK